MIASFYQTLAIPEACYLGNTVYKKLFYDNGALNAADKKAFTQDIDDIQWSYTLKPETINIPVFINEEYDYSEIAILQVQLRETNRYKRLAQIIQRTIPYPLLIIFSHDDHIALSVADKQINRVDHNKIKVANFQETHWIDLNHPSESELAFINSCTIQNFSYQNFYVFYKDLTARVIALQCAIIGGCYTLNIDATQEQRSEYLNSIHHTQQKITSLRAVLKKESQFNRKIDLNMQIKKLTQELEQHKQKIS